MQVHGQSLHPALCRPRFSPQDCRCSVDTQPVFPALHSAMVAEPVLHRHRLPIRKRGARVHPELGADHALLHRIAEERGLVARTFRDVQSRVARRKSKTGSERSAMCRTLSRPSSATSDSTQSSYPSMKHVSWKFPKQPKIIRELSPRTRGIGAPSLIRPSQRSSAPTSRCRSSSSSGLMRPPLNLASSHSCSSSTRRAATRPRLR